MCQGPSLETTIRILRQESSLGEGELDLVEDQAGHSVRSGGMGVSCSIRHSPGRADAGTGACLAYGYLA